jgi:chromate transporter
VNEHQTNPSLSELALLFLRLGLIGFGGPLAHIALMKAEFVDKRRWLTDQEFMELLGATHLIPGPNSTEMAMHIGHRMRGGFGLLISGVCFILPAFFLVLCLSILYLQFGAIPQVESVLIGMRAVIFAIISHALYGLLRNILTTRKNVFIFLSGMILLLIGTSELIVLLAAGMANVFWVQERKLLSLGIFSLPILTHGASIIPSVAKIFLYFLKIGSVLFGSGYVLFGFLRADLVEDLQWISEGQLLDAITIGQITPGPLFTTATFIGYLLFRTPGAIVATVGIFLPAFFFTFVSAGFLVKLKSSAKLNSFILAVSVVSLALLTIANYQFALTLPDLKSWIISILSFLILYFYKALNSTWLIFAGAVFGFYFS